MLPGDLFYFYACNSFNSIYYFISVWFSPYSWLQNISMTPSQEETVWFGDIPRVFHTLCKAIFSQVSGQKIPIASYWNGIFKRIPELFEIKIVTFPWQMIAFRLNPRCSLFMVNRDALFSFISRLILSLSHRWWSGVYRVILLAASATGLDRFIELLSMCITVPSRICSDFLPKIGLSQKEISSSNHPFSGANMLVIGSGS